MESLTESTWDDVIHGTGLQQSLLALYGPTPTKLFAGFDAALV